jgi:hypothetical protein
MKKTLRGKLTYANVLSTLCLFLLLGGGTAFAASKLAKNSVGAKQLKANSVTAAKIKKNAVTTKKIKANAVTAAQIKNGAVTGAKVDLATLGTVPSAGKAGSATTAATAGSAATFDGYARKGMIRVVATPAASYEAGLINAPQHVLFSAGPLTVYGQCFSEAAGTHGVISIKTSQNGVVFDSDESQASGSPNYLNTDTEVEERELVEDDVGANSADFVGEGDTAFSAMAPDGTTVRGDGQVGAKNGTLAAGNGLYGEGDACLFAGEMTSLGS